MTLGYLLICITGGHGTSVPCWLEKVEVRWGHCTVCCPSLQPTTSNVTIYIVDSTIYPLEINSRFILVWIRCIKKCIFSCRFYINNARKMVWIIYNHTWLLLLVPYQLSTFHPTRLYAVYISSVLVKSFSHTWTASLSICIYVNTRQSFLKWHHCCCYYT